MKTTIGVLLGALLLVTFSTRANTIRDASNYGTFDGAIISGTEQGTVSSPTAEVVVCIGTDDGTTIDTNCGSPPDGSPATTTLGYDLLVSIQSTGSSLVLNLPDPVSSPLTSSLTGSTDQGSESYGVWECSSGLDTNWNTSGGSGVQFCSNPSSSATQACVSALGTGSSSDSSISIPTACLVPGIVLYFDESEADSPTVTLETGSVPAPEPTPLALLVLGLAGLSVLGWTRRLQGN